MHEAMRIAFDNDNAGQAEKQVFCVFGRGGFKNAVIHQHLLKMQLFFDDLGIQIIPIAVAHGHQIIVFIAHKFKLESSGQ